MKYTSELTVKGGSLSYLIKDGEVQVDNCRAAETVFVIPDRIEDLPVTEISKKAFLGNKRLSELVLPDPLREVGDWAFAHCDGLKKVYLKKNPIIFGKGACRDKYVFLLVEDKRKSIPECIKHLISPSFCNNETNE